MMMNSLVLTGFHARLQALNERIASLMLALAAIGLVLMAAIIGWQVFGRYVLNESPQWSESLALLVLLYFINLGTAVGVREKFHLGIVFLVEKMPKRLGRIVDVFGHIVVGLFGILMMISGIDLASYTFDHVIPTLNVSRAVAYLPFAISGFLILLFSVEHVVSNLLGNQKE